MNGVVTSLDRERGLVRAVLDDGSDIECGYLGGIAPWPLAGAWFTEDPEPICLGAYGDRRRIFYDDFMWGFEPGTNRWDGDGNWHGSTAGAGSITDLDNPGTGAAGAVRIDSGPDVADLARLRKLNNAINLPDDGSVLWMSARVAVSTDTGARVGLGQDGSIFTGGGGGLSASIAASSNGGSWNLANTNTAGVLTAATTGEDVAEGVWTWIDLMVVASQWSAMWINGSGPWVNTTGLPGSSSDGLTPFLYSSTPGSLDVDLVEMHLVNPVNNPLDYASGVV